MDNTEFLEYLEKLDPIKQEINVLMALNEDLEWLSVVDERERTYRRYIYYNHSVLEQLQELTKAFEQDVKRSK